MWVLGLALGCSAPTSDTAASPAPTESTAAISDTQRPVDTGLEETPGTTVADTASDTSAISTGTAPPAGTGTAGTGASGTPTQTGGTGDTFETTVGTVPTTDTAQDDSGQDDTGASCDTGGALLLDGTIELDAPGYTAKLNGEDAGDYLGRSVQAAGDVNADEYQDFLLQASSAMIGTDTSYAYLVLGPVSGEQDILDVAVRLVDETPGAGFDYDFGEGMARGADFDGLGVDDVVLSQPEYYGANPGLQYGAVYLFAGPFGVPGTTVDATSYTTRIVGANAGDHLGDDVDSAGDLNGDGYIDLVASARDALLVGPFLYIFYGPLLPGDMTTADADVVITDDNPNSFGFFGANVQGVGDTDGDGLDDLATTDPQGDQGAVDAGTLFVFNGPTIDGSLSSGADGLRWADNADDTLVDLAAPGDVNGDGYADIAVGAGQADYTGTDSGSVWIVHGPVTGQSSVSTATVRIDGFDTYDQAAFPGAAGDLDLDGLPDLLIGAPIASGSRSEGGIYVLYSTVPDGIHVVDDVAGAVVIGENAGDWAYRAVGVGDTDGDCMPDIVVGAPVHDALTGAAYVVSGGFGP